MTKDELNALYPDAVAYLKARNVEPSDAFYARLAHLRQTAWTVKRLATIEQMERVKQSLVTALAEGQSFATWRKNTTPEMLALPKHYQETVFRTATLSSYNGAKWASFRDNAHHRPILRYSAINDSRTRAAHSALHGLMMPVDDPRWQTLAAPNGINCRCTMLSLSERQARAFGYDGVPEKLPTYKDKHGVAHTCHPDKGWANTPENPQLTELLRQREEKAGLSKAVFDDNNPDVLPPPTQWKDVAKTGEEIFNKHADLFDAVDYSVDDSFSAAVREVMQREGVKTGLAPLAKGDQLKKFNKIIADSYPSHWVEKANDMGTCYVRALTSRGFQVYADADFMADKSGYFKHDANIKIFAKFADDIAEGDSLLKLNNLTGRTISGAGRAISVHEFGHRIQQAMPELDAYFKQFWLDRTEGEVSQRLNVLAKIRDYDDDEIGRRDNFADVYIGKNYGNDNNPDPKEVLTMTFQALLSSEGGFWYREYINSKPQYIESITEKAVKNDREMLYLGLGLLMRL